jgi:hypothetical protein
MQQTSQKYFSLFLISSLGLFLELAVIRWLSAEVRLFSYFKNLPLLAAFLGLAIGFMLVGKGNKYKSVFTPMFSIFVILTLLTGRVLSARVLAYPSKEDEFLWSMGDFSYWLALGLFLGTVLVFFLQTLFVFIPIGQATGEEMARHAPLPAYIINLVASLAGVWAFALLSFLETPPVVWFAVALLGLSVYWGMQKALTYPMAIAFTLLLVGIGVANGSSTWSPYHKLDLEPLGLLRQSDEQPVQVGYTLKIQEAFYQSSMDLSEEALQERWSDIPAMQEVADGYNLPYQLVGENAQVLVVGAGMGNDVAAALRNGAERVEAVEIDPAIARLGHKIHPEHPYADPRVHLSIDDARSFLTKHTDRYDIVVFGFLDSQILLSGLSNVRLDSFIYTVESFQDVRAHLKENGVVVVSFATQQHWVDERLGRMLAASFGKENVLMYEGGAGTYLAAGLTPPATNDARWKPWNPNLAYTDLPLAFDDWPYLYMRKHTIPDAYWQMLLLIAVICFFLMRRSFPSALHPDWHFWLLGAAFLLIEFKSITEFALLFGTTWMVNTLAISGVLLMALFANLLALRIPRIHLGYTYALLFLSLAVSYLIPLEWFINLSPVVRAMASMLYLSLPMFFAGLIFSESLRRAGETARPLASNLSGSFAGGVLEHGSLLWGIKSLYLIAMIVYAAAWLVTVVRGRQGPNLE